MRLDEIFEVRNGIAATSLELLSAPGADTVPFLRPSNAQQRTLAGWVRRADVPTGHLHPAGSVLVSTNGEGSHTYSYVSSFEFAANSDVSILQPICSMTLQERIFYARCITMNRYRFSYGRKPKGERLKSLLLPDKAPDWVSGVYITGGDPARIEMLEAMSSAEQAGNPIDYRENLVAVQDVFEVSYGTSLEMIRMTEDAAGVNFISRTSRNNGATSRVRRLPDVDPIEGGVLTVAGGGSVLETFVQIEPFYSGRDIFYLRPRTAMSIEELLFYATCIRAHMWRYSYGRQANRTLKDLLVPDRAAVPAWVHGTLRRKAQEIAGSAPRALQT